MLKDARLFQSRDGLWLRNGVALAAPFIPGVTMPTPLNVGLSNPALLTDLQPNSGSRYIVSSPNTVIENKTIKAYVRVDATSGVTTFRNCRFTAEGQIPSVHSEGATPTGFVELGLVNNPGGATIVIEDSVIEPQYHQWFINNIRPGGGMTVRRTVMQGGTDIFNFASGSTAYVYAEDSYLGPTALCSVSYDQRLSSPAYRTHNDGVQIQSKEALFQGFNCTIIGRAIHPLSDPISDSYNDGTWGACMTYSGPGGGGVSGFGIDHCWLVGGVIGQCSTADAGIVGTVSNSFVGFANSHTYGTSGFYHFRATTGSSWVVENTVWSAQLAALTRQLGGSTLTKVDGSPLIYATQGMSDLDRSLAGVRNGEL